MSELLCQRDPYLWSWEATVLSCAPSADGLFDVRVDESPFYPEGGGQPGDTGALGDARVVDTLRGPNGEVVHRTDRPVELGAALLTVDGERRFDHMQHHTAQHLITALAADRFGRNTTSFHLGAEICSIDLDGPLSTEALVRLEAEVNEEVRNDRPVLVRSVRPEDVAALEVRSRGLPEGHAGDVRLVEIAGLDINTCGGTHVAQLAELQTVHLIGVEKNRSGVRVSFVAGGRALRRMRTETARGADLTRLLKCAPTEFVATVSRLLDDARSAAKERRAIQEELAKLLGEQLSNNADAVRSLHREDADLTMLQLIAASAGDDRPLLLTGGSGAAQVFLLCGPEAVLQQAGAAVAAALGGRGGGKGRRFQGKAGPSPDVAAAIQALEAVAQG